VLRCLRRLEARGEVRGGRFVEGFAGEQFALPEAAESLAVRGRRAPDGELICVPAADPLNLTGIVTPGDRVVARRGNRIVMRDGVPIAARVGDAFQALTALGAETEWQCRVALFNHAPGSALAAQPPLFPAPGTLRT
jgi:ATP-dependent Lhr-like helicase